MMFFGLASILSSSGPGNIATTALVAPMAMAVAARAQVPAFLMAIMVGHGATSGSLSPVAPVGIIASSIMTRIGLPGYEWRMYLSNLVAHLVVAFAGYCVLGGWRLFRLGPAGALGEDVLESRRFNTNNWLTLAVIAMLLTGVLFLGVNVGMGAFAGAVVLSLLRAADHDDAIRRMPWAVILMVSGVTVLIALLERTQGLDLFTSILAGFATPTTLNGMIAFVTGLVSVYSSTSGVVLPAFLPTIPGLIERVGGGDPISVAASINIGAHLVDVSPISTIGALCIAALVPGTEDPRVLFNKMLAWGLSMAIIGAILCHLFF
jgi:Na+/H+ antiporter NhaD/arsenite permease-like protein